MKHFTIEQFYHRGVAFIAFPLQLSWEQRLELGCWAATASFYIASEQQEHLSFPSVGCLSEKGFIQQWDEDRTVTGTHRLPDPFCSRYPHSFDVGGLKLLYWGAMKIKLPCKVPKLWRSIELPEQRHQGIRLLSAHSLEDRQPSGWGVGHRPFKQPDK